MDNDAKLRPLLLLQILKERTDEDNYLTTSQLCDILKKQYGMDTHRTTIKGDIEILQQAGFGVDERRSTQNQYRFIEREFEVAELKTIIDAIASSKFITEQKSGELIKKVTALAGANKARTLKRNVIVDGRRKLENEHIFYIIDTINDAINQRKKISFQKVEYNVKKERVLHHGGETYTFSPYSLVWDGDNYYVIGYSDKYKNIKNRRGTGKFGRRPQTTAWGRLLVCQCGNKFNCHYSSRKDRTPAVDYQCYTSVNIGSKREREKRGLSTVQSCDSPFLPGWKLDFMAKDVFERYISNAFQTVELAYTMLEAHIADKEEIVDNSDIISRKKHEIERLTRKRENLIGMREDGDIDRSYFRDRKNELDKKIEKLTNDIQGLEPQEVEKSPEDFTVTLRYLKKKLESYVPCEDLKIPTSIVEAFIEKIWVSKDEFRWYLRRSDNPKDVVADEDRVMIGSFTLNFDQAKEYMYSFSTRRRVYKWFDLNVSVWL